MSSTWQCLRYMLCAMQKRKASAAKRKLKRIELNDNGAEDSVANASVGEQVRWPSLVLLPCYACTAMQLVRMHADDPEVHCVGQP